MVILFVITSFSTMLILLDSIFGSNFTPTPFGITVIEVFPGSNPDPPDITITSISLSSNKTGVKIAPLFLGPISNSGTC